MAATPTTVWEIQDVGVATNGGGFDSAARGTSGIDLSRGGTTTKTVDASVTTVTCATALAIWQGNYVYLTGGVGGIVAGRFLITAVSPGVNFTINSTCGAGPYTGVTAYIGGPVLGWANISSDAVNGNTIYIKKGAYAGVKLLLKSATISADVNMTFAAGGGASTPITIEGYLASRGDLGIPLGRPKSRP